MNHRSSKSKYRGYVIYRTAQGNYWSDAFGSNQVAATLTAMHGWIDKAIVNGEIRRREVR